MAYVDLNPVRAAMADTPEQSDYTSIQQRALKAQDRPVRSKRPRLLALVDVETVDGEDDDTICRFRMMDYLELVDSTGRAVRAKKRGAISAQAAGVLDRLGIDERAWLAHMRPKMQRQPVALGAMDKLKAYAQMTGRKWIAGQSMAGC